MFRTSSIFNAEQSHQTALKAALLSCPDKKGKDHLPKWFIYSVLLRGIAETNTLRERTKDFYVVSITIPVH